jgi:hypothetical protein
MTKLDTRGSHSHGRKAKTTNWVSFARTASVFVCGYWLGVFSSRPTPTLNVSSRTTDVTTSETKLKVASTTDVTTSEANVKVATLNKGVDLMPHLKDCDKPQSSRTLKEMALHYKPTKFYGYLHANFDRFYPQYLEKYRGKHFRMLEIGLDTGNGTLLWEEYFPCATLVGLEYNVDNTKNEGASTIQTIVGDQGNALFLQTTFLEKANGGNFDLIIDDGGHHYEQQRTSYEILFDKALNPGGLYIMEDVETSYWKRGTGLYGSPVTRGGRQEPLTIVNQFKAVVDVVNKKFHDNTYTVFGQVDHLISIIGFGSNVIFLEKKTLDHCLNERHYVWPDRLEGPAGLQPLTVNVGSLIHKFCANAGINVCVRDRRVY